MTDPQLRAPLNQLLDDAVDASAVERVRLRLHASRRVPPRRLAPTLAAAAVVLLVVGGALFAGRSASRSGPLLRSDGAPLALLRGEASVSLDDGSRVTLGPDVTVEPVENREDRLILVQGDGHVTYDVEPGGRRRWSVDAGAVTVDVVGTRFTIDREGPRVRVSVERGRVRVRGADVAGGLQRLTAGGVLEVGAAPPSEPTAPSAPSSDDSVEPQLRERPEPRARAGVESDPRPARLPRWRTLATRQEHDEAFALLGEDGFRDATARARSTDELFALADIARLSGHPALAVAPLRRIVETPGPGAPVAALTLGRLELDALDHPADAARSLDRALELGLPEHLRETALARSVDAHRRAGHAGQATTLAVSYLAEFPDGRYAAEIRDGM